MGPTLNQYHVLLDFKHVFPKDLPRLPPKREIDFIIDLKPSVEPISKTPYMMTMPELC